MSRGLLENGQDDDLVHSSSAAPAWLAAFVVAAFTCAVGTGWLFVLGFKYRSDVMVQVAVVVQIALSVLVGLSLLVLSVPILGIIILCLAAVWAYLLLVMWRDQVKLVSKLLAVAGQSISENPGVVTMTLGLQAFWGLLAVPVFIIFLAVAMQNGYWTQNPVVHYTEWHMGTQMCKDQASKQVDCCTWQLHGYAAAYVVHLSAGALWATMVLDQIKQFTVAGTVAQWYFMPLLPAATCGTACARNRVATSFQHALGPSFGSLCAAGMVMAVVNFFKQMLSSCERAAQRGRVVAKVLAMVLAVILRIFLSWVECFTKFTTVRMAITGEAFLDAAKNTYELLKRNGMDALGMWWLPGLILVNCAFMTAIVYGALVACFARLVFDWSFDAAMGLRCISGAISVLSILFFVKLLLIAVDTLFMAAAMDFDAARVTRQDVHNVLREVPGMVGKVIEQPDGNIAYGASGNSSSSNEPAVTSGHAAVLHAPKQGV